MFLKPIQNLLEPAAVLQDAELYAWLINHCQSVSSPKGIQYLAGHGISLAFANRFNLRELRDPKSLFGRLLAKWGVRRMHRSGIAWGDDTHPERLIWGSSGLLFPFYKNGTVSYLQARMFEGNRKYPKGKTRRTCWQPSAKASNREPPEVAGDYLAGREWPLREGRDGGVSAFFPRQYP